MTRLWSPAALGRVPSFPVEGDRAPRRQQMIYSPAGLVAAVATFTPLKPLT